MYSGLFRIVFSLCWIQTEHPDAGGVPAARLVQDTHARTLGAALGAQLPRSRACLPSRAQALATVHGRARAGRGAHSEPLPQQYPGRGLPESREYGHWSPGVHRAPWHASCGRAVQSAHQVRARRR